MDILSVWFTLLCILGILIILKIIISLIFLFKGQRVGTSGLNAAIFTVAIIVFFPVFVVIQLAKKY